MSDVQTVAAILQRALSELIEREERLLPFLAEHDEAKRAIGVLNKTLDRKPSTLKGAKAGHGKGGNPRAAYTEKVIAVVADSMEPMTTAQISTALEHPSESYLSGILGKARERGLLRFEWDAEAAEGYWTLPSSIDPHEED